MSLFFEDYEALEPGHRWQTESRLVTMGDIEAFAELTGDTHPQHIDLQYGRESAYGTTIAHGFLTVSLASGLVYRLGLDRRSAHAILEMSWTLSNPVVPGDEIFVTVTLLERRASKSKPGLGIVRRRYEIVQQSGALVGFGEVAFMIKRRSWSL